MKALNFSLSPVSSSGLPKALVALAAGIVFSIATNTFSAPTTVLYESFEGNFPGANGWCVGDANPEGNPAYWGAVDAFFGGEGPHVGEYKGYCAGIGQSGNPVVPLYQNYMRAYMSKTLDLANYNKATLTFWSKIPSLEDIFDIANVYIDTNLVWSSHQTGVSWTEVSIDLQRYTGGAHTLKFQFDSDVSGTAEGWYLDDIMVTADFVPGAPTNITLLAPADAEVCSRCGLQFCWQEKTNAAPSTWFRLYVVRNGQKYMDCWTQDCEWQAANPAGSFPGGEYTCWVQGWNAAGLGPWSDPRRFTVQTNLPSKLTLDTPNGESRNNPCVLYGWIPDPETAWYELCVKKNGTLITDKWTQNDYEPVFGHAPGTYQWWVRGWNPDGMGPWSEAGSVSVYYFAAAQVSLFVPVGTMAGSDAKEFAWNPDPYADWYCFSLNCNNTNCLTRWIQTQSSLTLSNTLSPGNYSWRVAAWNSLGMSPWSTNAYFTVASPGTPYGPTGTHRWAGQTSWCYQWYGDTNTTWYELYINRNGALFYDTWLPASSLTATNGFWGTCVDYHGTGTYLWWVRAFNPKTGTGAWSSTGAFTLTP